MLLELESIRKMKIKYLKLKNWLLVTLMGALGLSACHTSKSTAKSEKTDEPQIEEDVTLEASNRRGEMALMYGVPTMDYVLKGKVVGSDGKPVKGMQVIFLNNTNDATPKNLNLDNPYVKEYVEQHADTTDADGNYKVKTSDTPQDYLRVYVRDIDGPLNGNYKNDVINVRFDESDKKDSGHGWRVGTMEKELTIKPDQVK